MVFFLCEYQIKNRKQLPWDKLSLFIKCECISCKIPSMHKVLAYLYPFKYYNYKCTISGLQIFSLYKYKNQINLMVKYDGDNFISKS